MTKGRIQLAFRGDYDNSLQAVRQKLVHLGDASRDGEIDGAVANLDDESTNNVRVNLGLELATCATADRKKSLEGPVPRW